MIDRPRQAMARRRPVIGAGWLIDEVLFAAKPRMRNKMNVLPNYLQLVFASLPGARLR